MSIASELTTLAANKAAIKSAIEAKSPVTVPTDALSQWPTAIASIPTGSSLSDIISATEGMDGLDHTGATASELSSAIKQITRQYNRRSSTPVTPPSIPVIEGYENGSAFAIDVTQGMIDENSEGRGGFTFWFYGITKKNGHSSYSVHWGDGTQNTGLTVSIGANSNGVLCFGRTGSSAAQTGTNGTVTDGTAEVCHTYTTPGTYVIQISDDIDWFGFGGYWYYDTWMLLVNAGFSTISRNMRNAWYAVSHALRWGNGVVSAGGTYANCYNMRSLCAWNNSITYARGTYSNCVGLTGSVPAWNNLITNAVGTYGSCSGLIGSIPAWGSAIIDATATYNNCSGLTGSIPAWGSAITNASSTYGGCSGLTGSIPAWGSAITNAYRTYTGCNGLTGSVPAWNNSISNAEGTYEYCSGLTGSVPAWGSKITTASNTYSSCKGLSSSVPAWGSAMTNAHNAYVNCPGLTGSVPAWGSTIIDASGTYNGCSGLTGSIPAWGSAITNASSTYSGCSDLTGSIPAWGSAITNANSAYNNCRGLTGVWDSTASDAELMPSTITNKGNCVANCLPDLRQYFLTTWGGTRAS